MAGISNSDLGKNAIIGTRADVQTCFSFTITEKAVSRDQAVSLGLDVPEKYTVWPVEFCNTDLDRHNERFTKSVLDVFASQMTARNFTFNLFHRSDKGIGKTLRKATVEPNATGYVLKGFIAISDKSKLPDQDILVNDAIAEGIYTDVSVEISGTTEYITDPQGSRGVWEYYVDVERPGRTQFMGAALVAMGAQIGATIVKSIDGNPKENSNPKNMNHFSDKFLVGGDLVSLKTVEVGGNVTIEGLQPLIDKTNTALKEATEAKAKEATATAKTVELEAELKAARFPVETDILNLQTVLKESAPKTAEDLGKMKSAEIHTLLSELRKKHDTVAVTEKAVTEPETKSYFATHYVKENV